MTMCCPITGVNIMRFLITVLAGFALIFGFDFVLHHKILADIYPQFAHLWRPEETMSEYFPLIIIYQVLLSMVVVFIFTRNYEGKGIGEGLRFGFIIGLLLALLSGSAYIWMPISKTLAFGWAAGGLGNGLILGLVSSILYKK